jgi:Lrp/AsnC family transcriptional regulator for asnA, asnC and gidA
MDETDLTLIKLLLVNARSPYRHLADQLGLSVNAVHKRIQALIQSGVIKAFTAKASLAALGGHSVHIFGRSESGSLSDIMDTIGSNESTYWVSVAGGDHLYVGGYLRDISELASYSEHVSKVGEFRNPTIGLMHSEGLGDATLGFNSRSNSLFQPLDYEIIYSLQNNCRKAITDVAEEIGVSAKTARRRLKWMTDNGMIELSLEWYPDKSNDIITFFDIELLHGYNKTEVSRHLYDKYSPNLIFVMSYSNLPMTMWGVLWATTMSEMREIGGRLGKEEKFSCSTPNVVYSGKIYESWREELVIREGAPRS